MCYYCKRYRHMKCHCPKLRQQHEKQSRPLSSSTIMSPSSHTASVLAPDFLADLLSQGALFTE